MATKIVTKNSSTASAVPTASDLVQGELAVNVADKRLFTEDNAGAIVELGTNPSGNVTFQDNGKAIFGAGSDLQIYHNATSNIIDSSAATLAIQAPQFVVQDAGGTKNMIWVPQGGSGYEVQLAHDGTTKLTTTSTGIDVTGTATMDGLSVEGDALVKPASGSAKLYLQTSNTTSDSQLIFGDSSNNNVGGVKYSHSNDAMRFEANGAERMRISSAGNVGIGVVPKTWYSASTALEIGSMSFEDYGVSGANVSVFANNLYRNTSNAYVYKESDFAASYSQYNGEHTFNTAPSGTADSVATLTPVLKIDSSGNVGIGTTNPDTSLHVTTPSGTKTELNLAQTAVTNYRLSIPASTDALTFVYGANTERMRIDSSGNLLVGQTTASSNTVGTSLRSDGRNFYCADGNYSGHFNRKSSDGAIVHFAKDDTIVGSIGTTGSNLVIGTGDTGFRFFDGSPKGIFPASTSSGVTDGAIDLGKANGRFKDLYLSGAVNLTNSTTTAFTQVGSNMFQLGTNSADPTVFYTSGAESMRIDSSGNLTVGDSSTAGSSNSACTIAAGGAITTSRAATNNQTHHSFMNPNGVVGTIKTIASQTSFNTSSDQRLKENIADADDAGSKVDAIQVRQYDWKADGSHQDYGMIAQELLEVAPEAVSQGETEEEMMGVDYSKLVPMLIKEIQSLRNRVAQLEE